MKLPRIRYTSKLEGILNKINSPDLNETIKNKKNTLMDSLESAKDESTLKILIRDWLYAFMEELQDLNKLQDALKVTTECTDENKAQMSLQISMIMCLDEISYLGWLRYQMILGKKVEK